MGFQDHGSASSRTHCWWPRVALGLALAWAVVVRVPLVWNAGDHLDSDLAVDGLTLLEATRGHWRWHYPGTPGMGAVVPVLLSWPQALVWGANPVTLTTGGLAAYLLLIAAVFALTRRTFGPSAAGWALVPLAFASTGALWLSGRVTGGHLLAAVGHAGAFALLHACLTRGGGRLAAALGVWCGIGVYLDAMFLTTLAGLAPAAVGGWWALGASRRGAGQGLMFVAAFCVGIAPREAGRRADPYDAYHDQFQTTTNRGALRAHARLLGLECLPRLITGRRLPGFQADPDPAALSGGAPLGTRSEFGAVALAAVATGLALFGLACATLIGACVAPGDVARRGVCAGLLLSAALVALGFIFNKNIYNSDNYRYLVTWLVPWTVGLGAALDRLARRGGGGRTAAVLCALVLAGLMTMETARWYARFGWVDGSGRLARPLRADPALAWLDAHREIESISGGYWDVYRLSFLTGGRVRGAPYPVFPNRFPEWSRDWPGGHPAVLLARPTPEGDFFARRVLQAGGRTLPGARGLTIISWP